ncbi:MAG TPA: hypothetical protein VGR57_20425 [Ktedonobacterales bacterium]|nr:hypothetical protein [Ktedonobacterales bacterium]
MSCARCAASATLLMREAQRTKLVAETVILMARQIISSYTSAQITPATAREAASATIAASANELLEPQGVLVDRICWRGSQYPAAPSSRGGATAPT